TTNESAPCFNENYNISDVLARSPSGSVADLTQIQSDSEMDKSVEGSIQDRGEYNVENQKLSRNHHENCKPHPEGKIFFTLLLGYFSGFSGFYLVWIFVYTWIFPGVEEGFQMCCGLKNWKSC
ncbi:MAG: hypothetical protein GY707_14810, partial [Desulfobacteraceae bacterium]|nr:hypothetical protein [Desulfobacteraceae bacterium]